MLKVTLSMRLTALVATTALVLIGCSSSDTAAPAGGGCLAGTAGDVAVVASGRQNSPAVRLDGDSRRVVAAALDSGHTVYVVNLDGRPSLAAKVSADDLPANSSRAEAVDGYTNQVAAALASLRADDPQVDVLAGLQLGASLVRASRGAVLLADSGLGTVAPGDFTQPGVLASQPADLPRFLRDTKQNINLADVEVGYINLGSVTAPQQPIPPALVTNLQAIYTELAKASNARCSQILTTPAGDKSVDSSQPVSLVPVSPPTTFTAGADTAPAGPVVLDATTVHFQPNRPELVDPDAADAVLAPIVRYLSAHPGIKIAVTGTCATGTGDGPDPMWLSRARAGTIASRLAAAGIDPARITAAGVGTDFPEFVPDTDAAGHLLPGPAAQNRTVRMTFS